MKIKILNVNVSAVEPLTKMSCAKNLCISVNRKFFSHSLSNVCVSDDGGGGVYVAHDTEGKNSPPNFFPNVFISFILQLL